MGEAMRKKDPKRVFVGIDISKDKLSVAWFGLSDELNQFEVANDEAGHREIRDRITAGRIREARVVLEATGTYGDRLFAALVALPKIRVMVVRPAAAKHFAKATNRRAKTDRVDATVLASFAKADTFKPTPIIDPELRKIRLLARHMGELIDRRAAVMNQRHAAKVGVDASEVLLETIDAEEAMLTTLIEKLEAEVLRRLRQLPEARQAYERLVQIPGIKDRTAARLLPELLCMPKHLSPRECIAFAGLDPRPNQSGTSKAGQHWRISKQGNSRLRRALYMAVLTSVRWFKPLKAFYERLRARGKLKMVALTASMRKLLTAVWVITAKGEAFDELKFVGQAAAA
jgi:transposase